MILRHRGCVRGVVIASEYQNESVSQNVVFRGRNTWDTPTPLISPFASIASGQANCRLQLAGILVFRSKSDPFSHKKARNVLEWDPTEVPTMLPARNLSKSRYH